MNTYFNLLPSLILFVVFSVISLGIPTVSTIELISPVHAQENESAPKDIVEEKARYRIQILDKAIEQNPDDINLYNSRGWYYFQLKEYEKVISDYDRVIELGIDNLQPNYRPAIYYVRGLAYLELEDQKSALENLQTAAEIFQSQNNDQGSEEVLNLIDKIKSAQ